VGDKKGDPEAVETVGNCVRVELGSLYGKEENGEIDRGLLKSFLLQQTVVPAIWNMSQRVLPTVQALSETAKMRVESRERAL